MIKRLFLLGICILGLLLPTWSQQESQLIQGPAVIEFLAFASTFNTNGGPNPWILRPDPTIRTDFQSPVLMSFDIPPSPKSPAVFFGIWGQYVLLWTSDPIRICRPMVGIRLTSPAIPDTEFAQAYGVPPVYDEINVAGNYTYLTDLGVRHKGHAKLQLSRGDLSVWWIRDRNTGQQVPDDLAIKYINKIIDSGFKVEVYASGTVQGLSYVQPFGFTVEVTRIGPKNQQNEQR